MRKWMVWLVALAVMVCACQALAEDIDIGGLSDNQVIGLYRRLQDELVARHIEATATLAGGNYIGGRDIPIGSYVYTCLATGDDWGNVTIYSEKGEGEQLFWEVVSAPKDGEAPESFFISLGPDDRLKSSVPFSLTIYAGANFK
ncbi:MAG: hypothetical protein ACSW8J_10575 [bacterium]